MISNYLSGKLKIISFFSMVLIVYRHAYNLGDDFFIARESEFSFFVQVFFSSGITSVAVPLFFTISGYFLFLGKSQSFENYQLLLKKRFSSLMIPYLVWTLSWFIFFYLKAILFTGNLSTNHL